MRKKYVLIIMLLTFLLAGSSLHAEVLTVDNKKVFDYVISYWDVIHPSTIQTKIDRAKRMEEIIQHWAIATYAGTRGAHTLGQVYILQGGLKKDTAHVKWEKVRDSTITTNPYAKATMGGYSFKSGGCITIWDETVNSKSPPENPKYAGYALAHEAGHFVYKLGNEYAEAGTSETSVDYSIMNNNDSYTKGITTPDASVLNFSTNHHIEKEKKRVYPRPFTNHQFKEYGLSCWETLMSSTAETSSKEYSLERVHYTNLSFTPNEETESFSAHIGNSRLSWSNAPSDVKNNLKIFWTHENAIILVIDRSGSMAGNANYDASDSPLTVTKRAAIDFVKALPDDCVLGVMDFDTKYSFKVNPDILPKDRSSIYKEINSITSEGGKTAMYDAVYTACQTLKLNYQNHNRTVVLITDGEDNESTKALTDILNDFQGSVKLHIIGTGDSNKVLLLELSNKMNGDFYDSSLREMWRIVDSVLGKIVDVQMAAQTILARRKAASLSLAPYDMESQETAQSFWVNSNSAKAAVTLSYQGKRSDISVVLKDPNGQIIKENIDHQDGKWTADLINPKMGQWNLDITYNANRDIEIDFSVLTYPIKGHSGYTANIGFLDENALKDTPIVDATKGVKLGLAVAIEGNPLTSINLQSQITHPSGLVEGVNFEDEDESGFYYLFYDNFSTNGVYTVNVKASNEDGKGKLSFKSYMGDNGPGGISDWEENFETTGMFQFIVAGAEPLHRVNSVWISDRSLIMEKGDRKRLSAFVTPSNATNQQIDWFSSDNSVAVVDRNGDVEALKGGVTVITAITADGNHQAYSEITVYQEEKAGCHTGLGAIALALAILTLLKVKRRR